MSKQCTTGFECYVPGASVSEPHTSELNRDFHGILLENAMHCERANEVCCRFSSTVEDGALSLSLRSTRLYANCEQLYSEAMESTGFRRRRALGCSVPSVARTLLRALKAFKIPLGRRI